MKGNDKSKIEKTDLSSELLTIAIEYELPEENGR